MNSDILFRHFDIPLAWVQAKQVCRGHLGWRATGNLDSYIKYFLPYVYKLICKKNFRLNIINVISFHSDDKEIKGMLGGLKSSTEMAISKNRMGPDKRAVTNDFLLR